MRTAKLFYRHFASARKMF